MHLAYVFDAYCGWSYGFAPTLEEIVRRYPELRVEVVSGGLFTGERVRPLREFGYVGGANAKITELTGAEFGEAYDALVAEGSFVMDSLAAARGVAALRELASPAAAPRIAHALQRAFYLDGRSLSDPETYASVAEQEGLDPAAAVKAYLSIGSAALAQDDFDMAASLGVTGFPTLLAVNGDRTIVLATGAASADNVDRRLDHARAVFSAGS